MSRPLPRPWTVEDFLAWERRQPERYEFVGGVIRIMVGGSNAPTIIKDNVVGALRGRLRGQPCRALGEGPKVVIATATMYPDAIVVCGPIDLLEDQVRAPTIVVEVLSRSTEDYGPWRQMGRLPGPRVASTAATPGAGCCRCWRPSSRSPCPRLAPS